MPNASVLPRRLCLQLTPRPESEWADKQECLALFEAIEKYILAGHEHLTPRVFKVIQDDTE